MEYANMSNKALDSRSKEENQEKKKLDLGSVQVVEHKPGFFERVLRVFIADDVVDIKGYLVNDVLKPGLKDLTADIIHGATDAIIFGNTDGARRYRGKKGKDGTVNYASFFASNGFANGTRQSQRSDRLRPIIASSRAEAEDLLSTMMEYIEAYGSVSVGDVYGALEWDTNPNDFKWGWEALGAADVVRVSEGYQVKLPRPQSLV